MATILLKGLDISKYQPKVNWSEVKKAGYDFVIIKCGYRGWGSAGTLATDPYFKSHVEGAYAAGLKVGIYWFTQAKTTAEAEAEADYCLKLIAPYKTKISLPIYDDVEYGNNQHTGRADNLTKAQYTANALAFCKKIKNAGYQAGVYACEDWCKNKLDIKQFSNAGYSIWCAKYSSNSPSIGVTYDIWQYSSTLKLSAITDTAGKIVNVDVNNCYKNFGSSSPSPSWKKDSKGWTYGNIKSDWKKINGYWYWFDANGYAVTGWNKIKNVWYYFCTILDHDKTGYPECSCLEISKS